MLVLRGPGRRSCSERARRVDTPWPGTRLSGCFDDVAEGVWTHALLGFFLAVFASVNRAHRPGSHLELEGAAALDRAAG